MHQLARRGGGDTRPSPSRRHRRRRQVQYAIERLQGLGRHFARAPAVCRRAVRSRVKRRQVSSRNVKFRQALSRLSLTVYRTNSNTYVRRKLTKGSRRIRLTARSLSLRAEPPPRPKFHDRPGSAIREDIVVLAALGSGQDGRGAAPTAEGDSRQFASRRRDAQQSRRDQLWQTHLTATHRKPRWRTQMSVQWAA
jgi:hypothetical protein